VCPVLVNAAPVGCPSVTVPTGQGTRASYRQQLEHNLEPTLEDTMTGRFRHSVKLLVAGLAAAGLSTAVAVSAGPATASSYGTAPVVVHHPNHNPKIINLRIGEHGSFDRVVIDMRGKMAGYNVRFVKHLTYDGSGQPVPLKGKRFVSIVLNPASAHDKDGNSLYQGPTLQQYDLPSLRGVAFTGDFEGYVSFGISLTHKAPFRVNELSNPTRLVIDFKH
jgi:hypothetical protein